MAGGASDARIAELLVDAAANDLGRTVPQGPAAAGNALGAAAENYQLNKVKFTIVRYDLPSEFYMSQAAKLGSGGTYQGLLSSLIG